MRIQSHVPTTRHSSLRSTSLMFLSWNPSLTLNNLLGSPTYIKFLYNKHQNIDTKYIDSYHCHCYKEPHLQRKISFVSYFTRCPQAESCVKLSVPLVFISRGSVSAFTLVRLEFRLVTPVGNFTVWNMASNRTDRCLETRPRALSTTPSTRSSRRPVQGSTYPEP